MQAGPLTACKRAVGFGGVPEMHSPPPAPPAAPSEVTPSMASSRRLELDFIARVSAMRPAMPRALRRRSMRCNEPLPSMTSARVTPPS